jgi:hypothetical protein
MDRFCDKLVRYIVNQKHISFEKPTSLLQNPVIENPQYLYSTAYKRKLERVKENERKMSKR